MPGSSPPTDRAAALKLRITASSVGELAGRELELDRSPLWIGRSAECDLVIGSQSVSRRHARVEERPDGPYLIDNGSANGITVNGVRVPEVRLTAGLDFRLGDTAFAVIGPPPPAAAPVAVEAVAEPAMQAVERTMAIADLPKLAAQLRQREAAASLPPVDGTMAVANLAEIVAQIERPQPLENLGEKIVTTANKPFLLDDPDGVWIVESGKVEIFTVTVEKGAPTGGRTHFLTVEQGEAFFGFDSERYGMGSGFLAAGKAGSVLRRFPLTRLMDLAVVPAHGDRIGKLLDRWLEGLSRHLTHDLPYLPTPDVPLVKGETTAWEPAQKAASGAAVLWIEMPAERFLLDGMASLAPDLEGVLFPVGPTTWLELLSETAIQVKPRGSTEAAADPRLWAGLDAFHRVLCECEFLNKRLAEVDELQRLEKKAEQVERAQESAYAAIGSVLGGTGIWTRPSAAGVDAEPVLRAAQMVGNVLGLQVRAHPEAKDDLSFDDLLNMIAVASRFRTRKVALSGDWWRHDEGPYLGKREDNKNPVAILPSGARSYVLVDIVTGTRQPIDDEVARTIEPFAYTFYRPLPGGVLKAKDIAKFGARGLLPEFRIVALMGAGVGILGTISPTITGKIFDTAIPQAERGTLYQFILGLVLAALISGAFKVTQNIAILRVQGKMDYSIQSAVWDRLIDLPMSFFRNFASGDLADRAGGVDQIRGIVAGAGVSAILGSISSIFNLVQMATYSLQLALVAMGLTLVYLLVTMTLNYLQLAAQRGEFALRGKIGGMVLQLIGGVGKIRVTGSEDHAFRMWALQFSQQRKISFRIGSVQNVHHVFNAGFPVFANMAIYYTFFMLYKAAQEKQEQFELTAGDFLAFTAAFGLFLTAMQALGDASLSMLKIIPVFDRLKPILETAPEVDNSKTYPGQLKGEIELAHVSFRYSESSPWILKDVSLKIRPGEFVAFVGGSGCGKSTLMKLMLGFEKPERGAVYYDGQDLATLDLRMVRQQLGVVLQDSRLLPADIYRNIVGTSTRTIEEAWVAAQKAGIADDVRAMPMGMHTVVSEGGGAFSGGQKQRLMIARALVNNPKIIFLDEATSALDNRAQAIVTESMNRLQATRIAIAHRLSTIIDADRICYFELGVLAESGTYQELMAKGGKFAELAQRQLA
jgi:ATP-binding cassette subfamily C protein